MVKKEKLPPLWKCNWLSLCAEAVVESRIREKRTKSVFISVGFMKIVVLGEIRRDGNGGYS
jgi:hypothetical protein